MASRKLQIFRFVLIEMFSPCFLNSRMISFLARSDCVCLRFLEVPAHRLCRVLRCFCRISRKVVQEKKTDKLTNFRSVEAAHSYVEHVAVVFRAECTIGMVWRLTPLSR